MTVFQGIVFSAKRGSGKTTACRILQETFPDLFGEKISFADYARNLFYHRTGITYSSMTQGASKEHGRKYFIRWCDDLRAQDPDVFCREWEKGILAFKQANPTKKGLCDDVRRFNEIASCRKMEFLPIRILCDKQVMINKGWTENIEADLHPTEMELDSYPLWQLEEHQVVNTGSEDDFRNRLCKMVRNWGFISEGQMP